ncbi:MAG: 2OG-Fe(II) oxygenase [Acidimicrobiia bacterium]|nr:2OG-Fe(II) oxygenase [Acidimicrobiia bacterium]
MINLASIEHAVLHSHPFEWAHVTGLFSPHDADALASSYPRDNFKTIAGYDGEKGYEYEARSLIHMGAETPSHGEGLSPAWLQLAHDLMSAEYRSAMSRLAGRDLSDALTEVNVFHYTPGSWLGPHLDLPTKIVTHVFYFNRAWNAADGGCLTILRSKDMADTAEVIPPLLGTSSVLVRSDRSWHAVSRVAEDCQRSRRSMTVTFYRPGSPSTMWPPAETPALHAYEGRDE